MIITEGGSRPAATVIQADSSHPGVINVADAELLAWGAVHRDGPDLHLNGRDGQHVIIPGYFASEHPATLVAPGGERLTADVLALLVGPATRDEYAQAQPAKISSDASNHIAPDAIGHVEKIVGDVTAVRDGVAVILHVGDAVYKSDIIQTGSSSSVGIFLSDGSAVNLVANTRMVLNAYSYGANSDSNAALAHLIDGTFAFVAGKVAHGGDMKIATPVATMSVGDGTSGWAHQMTPSEIAAISAKLGDDSSFAAFNDHGIRGHGIYDLVGDGAVAGSVDDPNPVSYLDQKGDLVCVPLNKSDLAHDFQQWLQENDAQPSTRQAIHGSGSPIDAPTFPQLVNLDHGIPSLNFNPNGGGTTFGVGFVPVPSFLPPGVGFVPGLPLPSSAATTETVAVSPLPPSISTGANATAVYETGAATPVALDTAVTVSDPDSNGNLVGAKVTISQGFLAGDTLSANTAGTSITASYDPTSGILTLSGTDTLAHYAQVLDSVTYASTATDPTNGGADTSRTVSWHVGDGVSPSNVATSTVSVVTGSATVADGGTLEISTPSNQTVTFAGGTGELQFDNPAVFGGHIVGFSATASSSDVIDLVGIDFTSPGFTESYDAAGHLLTVSDGTHGASLTLDYFSNVLNFANDGHGGTAITNQPATIASGGFLEISKLTVGTVAFGAATGTLQIDNPADFSGHIQNFTGTAPDAADSDVIDLVGIDYNSATFSYDVASGKLTVTEGALSASLTFDYFGNNLLNFASDGHGGTAITTQPANIASGGSLEISKLTVGTISFFGTGDVLALDNPGVFSGHIDGFSDGDRIDISGINFTATNFTESYNASTHLLTVGDGTQSASFYLDYLSNALNFAADGKGGTLITNQLTGSQTIAAGERLDVWGLVGDTSTITFTAGTGELKLDNPAGFSGHIAGFTGTQADATHSDVIDLVGINYNSGQFAETYDASSGKFTVTDGTNNASFTFDNFSPNATFSFASDGNGGTLILDPPKPPVATAPGSGDNFKFIFHPGGGADVIAHADWQHEGTDHPSAQSGSSTPAEIHRDWLMEPGHHDHLTSNTLQHLQAHLDSAVHLH
jgi:FecR protein